MTVDFDFRLKLEIGFKNTEKGIVIEDEYANPLVGLDMSAEIIKTYDKKPSPSKLTIYNVSTQIYNEIYEKADAFRLSCASGKDSSYVPFYTGYPIRATQIAKTTVLTSNEGFMAQDPAAGRSGQNDLETEITLMNYGFAQMFKSYRAGVSTKVVIDDCIAALGLPKGNMDTWTDVNLPTGFTIRGDVAKALDKLGNRLGFNWNTNDMKFNIYDKKKTQMKTYGIKLTPENSSTPEKQDDKFKGRSKVLQKASKKKGIKGVKAKWVEVEKQGFKVTTQLLPFLQCGATCYMDFDMSGARGEKYIYKIVHHVNNMGLDCDTEIYCV